MISSSKIYVAGHRGLVGSAIWGNLKKKGYNNLIGRTIDELDLTDQKATAEFFAEEKPEYVFLAAAKVGGIVANNTFRAEFIHDNLAIQNNVIHQSWKHGVKKLLFLGSTCIYPRDCPQPMKEEYLLAGPLEYTNEPYAIAKIAGIRLCESYNLQYGTDFLSVMPTNLYGPNDNFNLDTSHVLPALIRKIHLGMCLENNDWDGISKDLSGGGWREGEEAKERKGEEAKGRIGEWANGREGEEAKERRGEEAKGRIGEWANGRKGEGANGRKGEEAKGRIGEWANGRRSEGANGRIGEWANGRGGEEAKGRRSEVANGRIGEWANGRGGEGAGRREGLDREMMLEVLARYGIRIESATSDAEPANPIIEKTPGNDESQKALLPVTVTLWGSGAPLREFLWSEDMADACVFVMEHVGFRDLAGLEKLPGIRHDKENTQLHTGPVHPNKAQIRNTHINIGTGSEISIRNLAQLIKDTVGFQGRLKFDASKPDGTLRKLTDPSKLQGLGWRHTVELNEGVKRLYEWYLTKMP